ncbi:MAG: branched-chain amino acid ABC transporter permease [Myxococcota bacterium]
MSTFVQLLASGLALGAVYALVALGFVVIYRASAVFNFAQGELLTIGALTMVSASRAGLPWPLALAAAMGSTGLLAAGLERGVLRALVGRPVFVTIIVTLFLGFLLRTFALLTWGADPVGMPTPWDPTAVVELGGARVLWNSVAAVLAAGVTLGAFFAVLRYTRLGVAMRATAADQETALALGIPVGRIFGATWFVAGACAALAGVFLGMFPNSVDVHLGFVALRAFPAVIVGGLDSVGGTVLAGLMLGVLEVLAQGYVNPHLGAFGHDFHAVFPYVVMIGFLVVRPYGLFGTARVERV